MKLPRMKPGDLLVIKVYDLTSNQKWLSDIQAQSYPATDCALCGWFINKDKLFLRISSLVAGNGKKTIRVIPIGMLKSVKIVPYDRT